MSVCVFAEQSERAISGSGLRCGPLPRIESETCERALEWMCGEIKPSPLEHHGTLRLPYHGRLVQMSSPLASTSL